MKQSVTIILFCCGLTIFAQSPYIEKVYEYCPAPGQFVNKLPTYIEGDNAEILAQKATNCIANTANGTIISLGSWGGFVIVGFDHTILNTAGYDFKIVGNAFIGNAEPGIVMVSADENENGLPDDAWFEIAGSAHNDAQKNYAITYFRPEIGVDSILWRDSNGKQGFIKKNGFNTQNYFPQWLNADSLTFTGTRLPSNAIEQVPNYFVLTPFEFGYADNQSYNNDAGIDIDWAIDSVGNNVNLSGIDFIKIYTGVFQNSGNIGECSTEIAAIIDLNLETAIEQVNNDVELFTKDNHLIINVKEITNITIYNAIGHIITQKTQANQFEQTLPHGIYLVQIGQNRHKVIL